MTYEPGGSAGELLALLECSGPLTRSDLVRLSGLPRTTVTGMVGDLISRELIVERTTGQADRAQGEARRGGRPQAGRPPRTLASAAPPTVTAVLACGRSGIEAALVTYPGQIVARLSSPDAVGYQAADLDAIAGPGGDLVGRLLAGAGCSRDQLGCAVIGLPRPVGPGESAVALAERLAVPVRVENDANLGTLGEAAYGAGRGHDSFIYVKLGHNVGAGLVIGGRLHRGASGFGGELAHVQVRADGDLCSCGGRGCLAAIVGSSLLDYVRLSNEERLALPQILALAAERDPGVRRVFADLGRLVGRPLASFCTMFDPAAVVVDGSLGAAGQYVLAGVRESIDRHTAPVVADSVQVITGELGDRAQLLGGAALARNLRLAAVRGARAHRLSRAGPPCGCRSAARGARRATRRRGPAPGSRRRGRPRPAGPGRRSGPRASGPAR
jgi:predicted NBD/HSP70 family sugar kinase